MRKMIKTHRDFKIQLHTRQYSNGQLAVYIHDYIGYPIAELSIMNDLVTLAPNEFILKDYSENKELAQELLDLNLFVPTDQFILVGSHLCSVCQINS